MFDTNTGWPWRWHGVHSVVFGGARLRRMAPFDPMWLSTIIKKVSRSALAVPVSGWCNFRTCSVTSARLLAFPRWHPGSGWPATSRTSVVLGPDGNLYVGFLKNGNIKRVTNPSQINSISQTQTFQTVGGTPNGRPSLAMAFLGSDLYIATDQGLAVVKNAPACINNQGGCGNAVPVAGGFIGSNHVALTSDRVSRLYFSVNGSVERYAPNTGVVSSISAGFAFVGGHTNTLTLDSFGNLGG
jgi:hypothetical protein